jgi:hypothetical protein
MLVGGLPAALGVLLCVRWYFHVFCGVSGGKEMTKVLRTFFKTLYLWTSIFVSPLVISYHDIFVLFSIN